MNLRMKLLSLIGICALAFIVFGLVSWTTINKVKINGDVYNRIAQEKDLIADILPPPEYLLESYLVIHQIIEETDDTKLKELMQKSKKLREEYDERHKYWTDNLPDSPLKTELIAASYKPAIEYFKIQDEQVIAAILRNDRDTARQIMRTSMKAQYEEHRLAIDRVVKIASDLLAKDEQNIKEVVNSRTSLLLILGIVIFITISICGFYMNYVSVNIIGRIKQISEGLCEGAQVVVSASSQIASSSQNLAEGASKQVVSLEETASSLEEMSSMTKQNADNAGQAKAMMGEARKIVGKVNHHMEQMATAIDEITKSSEETGKIIKTIDEIAFQTNLLALRSAEAAKNTSNLIENTIKAVRNGNQLTTETQQAFQENIAIATKIGHLVDEIATASSEQAHGIAQVNVAVTEMDKVTQGTAANAEESASASEELNAQAVQMKSYVEELSAVVGGSGNGKVSSGSLKYAGLQKVKAGLPREAYPGMPGNMKALPSDKAKNSNTRVVTPSQIIPLGDNEFKDF